jgi:peptidylprolyl isomerase
MKTIENGNNVKLHYKGTFPDGEVFDDSKERGDALNVLIGQGELIKGLESALLGMSEGETKNIELTADQAYGEHISEAIVTAPKSAFPEDFDFKEGMSVTGRGPTGEPMYAKIISFTDTNVTLDHNHPLAGKNINFQVEILEIKESE